MGEVVTAEAHGQLVEDRARTGDIRFVFRAARESGDRFWSFPSRTISRCNDLMMTESFKNMSITYQIVRCPTNNSRLKSLIWAGERSNAAN